ncbi:MAG: SLBB domain-containing protein [Bacteroidota bacterium]|nr:SLBB domain-containing protein [Bacteroidota bacterium]
MKIVKRVLFVLFMIIFCSNQLHAQNSLLDIQDLSQVNIDNYSDSQLLSLYNKAVESGISESQLYKIAQEKGLPDSEIAKLKERLQEITGEKGIVKKKAIAEDEKNYNEPHPYDTSGLNKDVQKFQNDISIFGSELFTSNSSVFEPNLRIPAPVGYVLGPDDELIVSVYGYSEKKYNLTINESGEIYIPSVGPIFISGLSIDQATEKIKSKLASTIYRAINTGKTKIQVTLGKIKSIRVTVIGQAKKPGTFTVSSLTTLYNILYLCGGPTSMGSYRDIEIIRGNQLKRTADLYDFLVDGNQKDNILLQEGDVIRIPYYKNRVTISGNVKREGKFEILDNETFNDLLKYCGGFTDNAYRGAVTVIRITPTERKIIDLNANEYGTFKINGSDRFVVRRLQEEFGNRVVITGSVLRPGAYELTPELTLDSLIQKSGGLTRDAYTTRVSIFRSLKNKMPTMLSVDLDSTSKKSKDVFLSKDDSIAIHSIFEFQDSNYVSIEGNVRKPGIIGWRENFSLRDLLLSAGGISEFGDSSNIEISRRIRNADVNKANHNESEVINIDLTGKSKLAQNVLLQPYDIIIVKKLPGYTSQRTVLVLGDVKSPGRYALEKSGDKISDILKRVGGFKASADSSAITIRRSIKSDLTAEEREKLFQRILNISPDSLSLHPRLKDELFKSYDLISVDLTTALSNPNNSENLVLEDGDVLTIDRNSKLVKISGEVYYPTIIPYKENKSLKYYVQQAGNFTPYARKTGSLVIHADGKAASVRHFLWFKFYPSVTPRSEIFVPQKIKTNRAKLGIGELALIVSALGIIASVIPKL